MDVEISKHKVLSHPRYTRFLRNYLFSLALDSGFSMNFANDMKIAFSEAMNNIIQHAYMNQHEMPVIVEFHLFEDRMEILLRDFGRKVSRTEIRSRPLNEYRENGLGVFIMQSLMDYINYDSTLEQGTLLKMVKKKKEK